ncbi:hypothetical protein AGR5A_Lc110009 [Agrobacterium genomosp. 5 str. CFBP 6626]|nr:hypothetical protein AGR5A_Lc110009 [Agrobacterium genomosp. 5 str. CFBP 6626]
MRRCLGNMLPEGLCIVLRFPAKPAEVRIVPPARIIRRRAPDDRATEHGRAENRLDQRYEVILRKPGRQHAVVLRFCRAGADTDQRRLLTEFFEIHAGEAFAETFGNAVKTVWPEGDVRSEPLGLGIITDRVIGTGEDDSRLPMGAGCLIEVIKPDNIALKDLLERPLHRYAAEMDDAVTIGHHRIDGAGVGQIALQALFVRSGRIERRKIGKTQYLGHRCEALAHDTAELACRTGNKKPFHYNSPKRMDCGSTKLRKTRIQPLRRGRDISAPLDLIIQIVQKADNIYYVIYATIMKDEFDADRRNKAGRQPGIC